eukprot:7101175-Prymnesium_polylepis.1
MGSGLGRFRASRPRVSFVETSDVRICAIRCAQRLLPSVTDSHTALGRIAKLRSSDVGDRLRPSRESCWRAVASQKVPAGDFALFMH